MREREREKEREGEGGRKEKGKEKLVIELLTYLLLAKQVGRIRKDSSFFTGQQKNCSILSPPLPAPAPATSGDFLLL